MSTNQQRIPKGAVELMRHPLNRLSKPCDFDGDLDRFGRIVIRIDGHWWGWYPHPNEPLLPEKK